MNKKKNEEIKGFLKWFEREIGSEIDSLANKTAVKEYHEYDFNQFLEVLRKNRNKVSLTRRSCNKIPTLEKYRKSIIHECITGKRWITEDGLKDQHG